MTMKRIAALGLSVVVALLIAGAGRRHRHRIEVVSHPAMAVDEARGHKGGVRVAATAVVGHKYEPQELYWHLKVFRQDGAASRPVWGQAYDHQTFVTRPGRERTVTFREELMLPAGDYTLQVGVDEVQRSHEDEGVRRHTIISDAVDVHVD